MSTLNLNIGILGHIDSGKTSLAKVLSSTASTACFDKNPQSKQRGITLDLGFSSLVVDRVKTYTNQELNNFNRFQYTFVDCPGHASLIKTIIGGAQIIDLMILVIDITKGIQTQTAECLVIGEILSLPMVVVLNKLDLIPTDKQKLTTEKMVNKIKKTLFNTVFSNSLITAVAANPPSGTPIGLDELLNVLQSNIFLPKRHTEKPFVISLDHCFSIRGQGTILTGTVLQGTTKVNETVQVLSLGVVKRIKTMQMFKENVMSCEAGDRVALGVNQLEAKHLERGYLCTPGYLSPVMAVITTLNRVKFYKAQIISNAKFHITVGHDTVIGRPTIFANATIGDQTPFHFDNEYLKCISLFDEKDNNVGCQFAFIEFEKPLFIVPDSLFIASKLDMDVHTNSCRIAFFGQVVEAFPDTNSVQTKLKIYKTKSKTGLVDRVVNEHEVICKDMFKKETRLDLFIGLKVKLSSGECGTIVGSFGQTGKIRISVPQGLQIETMKLLQVKKSKKSSCENNNNEIKEKVTVELTFKQYIYDPNKMIFQNSPK